jgi:protein-L-isoaspartate(D-aspartate) O-methyltransferase
MSDLNFETARKHMVESQIRTWEVVDPRVLDLMQRSPREDFVPAAYRNLAYADLNIPLGRGQVMMPPKMEARLLQALDVQPSDKILEVGTGSGYLTWLLANLGHRVISVEIDPVLSAQAEMTLAAHGIRNATLEVGDAARGWDKHAPYDVILITGSLPLFPETYQNSLAVGGRLVAVVGASPVMDVWLVRRTAENSYTRETLFETDLPPLTNAPAPASFVF